MRLYAVFLLAIMILAGCAQTASRDDIARTLRENPQLVYDALGQDKGRLLALLDTAVREQEQEDRRASLREGLANPLAPDLSGQRPFLGPADAPVTIVEYSDFLCPYCAKASLTVAELMRRHPGNIRLLFKHYPVHPGSIEPAAMFEAIGLQDTNMAWRFAEAAFANQQILADGTGKGVVALLAMIQADYAKLKKDSESREVLARIQADTVEARRFGIDGTPTFLVNGVMLRGAVPLADFEEVLGLLDGTAGSAKP
jgi:protein-disulfide isomerase